MLDGGTQLREFYCKPRILYTHDSEGRYLEVGPKVSCTKHFEHQNKQGKILRDVYHQYF